MSIHLTNAVQKGFNTVKTWGAAIVHSKFVQSSLEKVGFVSGYALMRAGQLCFEKPQFPLPAVVQDKIVNGKHEELDGLISIPTSKTFDQVVSPIADVIDPIQKGFATEGNAADELVSKYGFPKEILAERFQDFQNFILNSRLAFPLSYYHHVPVYDRQNDEISILVDGRPVGSKEILKNFRLENRAVVERMFLPPILVDKQTGERYAYLEKGLIRHDVDSDIRPFKILPLEQRPQKPQVKFNFRIDAKLESPEDADNFLYHAWCEIVQPSGACYSFGLYGKGVVQSPDPSSFLDPGDVRSIPFNVTPETVLKVFEKIQQLREMRLWNYHFAKYNCATFATEIGKVIGIDIAQKDKLKQFDGLITRIKMYAISSLLANQLRDPDTISKIGTLQEVANLANRLGKLPETLKDIVLKFSLENSFKSIPIANALNSRPLLKALLLQGFDLLQTLVEHLDAERFSDLFPGCSPVSALEIKELCRSALTGSTTQLTHKIYNLLDRIMTNYYEYELHSPGFLYEKVSREKQNQKHAYPLTLI